MKYAEVVAILQHTFNFKKRKSPLVGSNRERLIDELDRLITFLSETKEQIEQTRK